MTANQTAGLIAAASASNPGGGGSAVTGSANESLIARWSSWIVGAAKKTATALTPANIFVPGSAAAAKAATNAANAATSVATSAGEGIKAGFSKATFVIVIVIGFILWRVLR